MEKKTPLYEIHVEEQGSIVPFAGYLLPVQYKTGILAEHMAVREGCGMFDVSHMGEILCEGPDAAANLNHLLTNTYTVMADGQARYSPMCNESGGTVDDLIVYKVRDDHYFIVVNAANKDKDFAWMQAHASGRAAFTDISDQVVQIALQGPKAIDVLSALTDRESLPRRYYTAKFDGSVSGIPCIISRTGYTGEDGFELYCAAQEGPRLWKLLKQAGAPSGLIPCGLGARDTLRLEAAMPLYGHEMNDAVTPLEAGLGRYVRMEKEDFIGKEALQKKGGPETVRVGLKATGRGIVREQCRLYRNGEEAGITTSGTFCPYLKQSLAMASVKKEFSGIGTALEAEVRGRRIPVEVVPLPFYHKK